MMPKSEMGWVLQHMVDHGFCRDPIHRLGWTIGKVGFPIHFPGKEVEYESGPKIPLGLGSPLSKMRRATPQSKR